jgi:basic amino acid/polyamine antiporter, APA family
LGQWDERRKTPVNALVAQGAVSLLLVGVGTLTRQGFGAVVEYTAPVFWFFLLLVGLSLFVLRAREPARARAFRVPLYPVTPIIFCCTCAYLLYSSVVYTGYGALIGITVLLLGLPLLLLKRETAAVD